MREEEERSQWKRLHRANRCRVPQRNVNMHRSFKMVFFSCSDEVCMIVFGYVRASTPGDSN
jgi:hypothetical protein